MQFYDLSEYKHRSSLHNTMVGIPPLVTLEEHFLATNSDTSGSLSSHAYESNGSFPPSTIAALRDVSGGRIAAMDAGSITLQVISHAPASAPLSACRSANDELANAVERHPKRFAGLAMLPMAQPEDAARELNHCVRVLGFSGALIDNHLSTGEYYDEERFWPVFETAQNLDVPLYLHPTFPSSADAKSMDGNYQEVVSTALGAFGWGWHSSVALHVLRLFAAGVFERFPRLKIIVGHDGEGLSFFLERIEKFSRVWPVGRTGTAASRTRHLRQVWDENIYVTTSGMFSLSPMACLMRNTKIEHIMFSVDYPFSSNEDGRAFVEELARSGLVTQEQLRQICFKNAVNLLRLKAIA